MSTQKSLAIPSLKKWQMGILTLCFFMVFFVSSDISVFSTASVNMLDDIGGDAYYSLLFSLKGITVAVTCMLCGKLIEKVGRRNIILLGLLIQTVTTLTTALAPSMLYLLISRAIYGIGQGLSITAVMIMISELFGNRSGYGYLITLVGYGAGHVFLPLIVAALIESYTWRYSFWLLTALLVMTCVLLPCACPNYRVKEENSPLDKKGMLLFSVGLCIIVSLLSFGGNYLAWSSPVTIILIVVAFFSMVLFVRHERNVDQNIAIFPMSMLHSKLLIGCAIGQFTMSINSTCLYAYIPYYLQLEMGATPTQAGFSTSIISFLTTVVGSILLIMMVKAQRHSAFAHMTVIGETIAVILIYIFLSPTLSLVVLYALIVFYGLTQSVETYAFTMTVQSGLTASKVAIGTAIMQFVHQCSGVAATAGANLILNQSASMGAGMKNVFLFAAILTVAGAITFGFCVPSSKKIKEDLAVAQALEDG